MRRKTATRLLKYFLIPLSIFLFLGIEKTAAQCNKDQDSLLLIQFYNATGGTEWKNTVRNDKRWTAPRVPISNWYGVTTSPITGCVTRIVLTNNGLKDSFSNVTLSFPELVLMRLDSNILAGRLPNFNTPVLTDLNLENNKFTGQIPTFSTASNLRFLILANNKLQGTIPNFNLPQLVGLYLGTNSLSGQLPSFSNLSNLEELYLYLNNFSTSTLPTFKLSKLKVLSLFNCQLNTTIPSLDSLENLQQLFLNVNQLTGSIPNFKLQKLTILSLDSNKLRGCIPFEIRSNCSSIGATGGNIEGNPDLSTRSWANYWNNRQGACLPIDTNNCRYRDSIQLVNFYAKTDSANWLKKWNLAQPMTTWNDNINNKIILNSAGCVSEIVVQGNNLRGVLPDLNLPSLTKLDLSNNKLTGQIPYLSRLSNLLELDLDFNEFKDTIPNFNLANLRSIDFTNDTTKANRLTGRIPDFSQSPNLRAIYLRRNKLTGPIPDFKLKELTDLRLENNQLSGELPDLDSANVPKLAVIQCQNNRLEGCFPLKYSRFCGINRNFNGNVQLPNNGDFDLFCRTPIVYDTAAVLDTTLVVGDKWQFKVGEPAVAIQKDTIYQDTFFTRCKAYYNISKIKVLQNSNKPLKTIIIPNVNGVNEQLDFTTIVDWKRYPNSTIVIYNSWHQKVYEANPYNNDWTGKTRDGKDVPEGNYFFILKLLPDGETKKGVVYVKR